MSSACNRCEQAGAELAQARLQIAKLSTDLDNLSAQLHEMTKLAELQAADLERYRKVVQGQAQPNRPERVPDNQVQLGLERILASITDGPTKDMLAANAEQNNEHAAKKRSSTPHGRRNLELAGLPVEEFRIVPDY
jgi:multidrug resistance efflux pump